MAHTGRERAVDILPHSFALTKFLKLVCLTDILLFVYRDRMLIGEAGPTGAARSRRLSLGMSNRASQMWCSWHTHAGCCHRVLFLHRGLNTKSCRPTRMTVGGDSWMWMGIWMTWITQRCEDKLELMGVPWHLHPCRRRPAERQVPLQWSCPRACPMLPTHCGGSPGGPRGQYCWFLLLPQTACQLLPALSPSLPSSRFGNLFLTYISALVFNKKSPQYNINPDHWVFWCPLKTCTPRQVPHPPDPCFSLPMETGSPGIRVPPCAIKVRGVAVCELPPCLEPCAHPQSKKG